jgi:hypothetical protein
LLREREHRIRVSGNKMQTAARSVDDYRRGSGKLTARSHEEELGREIRSRHAERLENRVRRGSNSRPGQHGGFVGLRRSGEGRREKQPSNEPRECLWKTAK